MDDYRNIIAQFVNPKAPKDAHVCALKRVKELGPSHKKHCQFSAAELLLHN